ncbi:MAG: glycosyltransferase [Proteobacteria bacterium]|nr:glycosyltransferase [Pseudomonadota bacterium]
MKRKVLMFAYDYPPRGWSGVQRTVKFVRYMPEYGWDPIVVTTSDWYSHVPLDYSFCDEVAHAVTIRTPAFTREHWSRLGRILWRGLKPVLARVGKDEEWLVQGSRWRLETLLFPDEGVTWLPYAVRQGLGAVRTYKPAVIYATAPPYSTLISGWLVAKMSGLPLVVDLRDLWVDNPNRLIDGRIKKKIDRFLEHLSLAGAAAIITTTRTGADLLRTKYRKKSERIYTIYNGYDEKDFASHVRSGQSKGRREKLTISHVGSLYADRSPAPFLKGLAAFLQRKSTGQTAVTVRFVGKVSSFSETFKEYEHLGVVEIEEPVEHPGAVEIMTSSAGLLLIMPDGSQRVVYAKVFEYLASGCPILGILPLDGEVAELLRQAGNEWVVDVGDVDGISRCLNEMYERWCAGQLVGKTNQEYVRKFERKSLTAQLCEIFAAVAGARPCPSQVP